MKDLKAKTQSLKFERRLRQITERHALPIASEPCNCKAWLKKQVRKQTPIQKPQPKLVEFPLTLVAPAAPKNARNHDYNVAFEQGLARWYHLPVAALADKYDDELIEQLRYCALGTTVAGMGERSVKFLWSVLSVQQFPRHVLTVEQAGSLKASAEPYWLFELGDAVPLEKPILNFPQHFATKLTLKSEVLEKQDVNQLFVVQV
jgi:hypothetical protein